MANFELSENQVKLYNDPEYILLTEILRVLDSNKTWGGMDYNYQSIPAVKYKPLIEKIGTRVELLAKEYGVS